MSVPCTTLEILERIEHSHIEGFVMKEVPELFFWNIGLEYIDSDSVEVMMK
jgi:hypothetical protein